MHSPTSDLRIRAIKPLTAPKLLEAEMPLDDRGAELISESRGEIGKIISGQSSRLLVIVGPCSIHDPKAAVEYAQRLCGVAEKYRDELLVVMRVYFEKPRTVLGWKGLINDPFLDGTFQIDQGLRIARRLLIEITAQGLPVANEFLDTTLGQYYADLVSWGAIGARTVESQVHRELASGLSMPVGFKNRTDGNVQVAIDAIRSAAHPHWFPTLTRDGVPAVLGTTGNDQCHVVLRGGTNGPNFDASHVRETAGMLKKNNLSSGILIDCSHANSGKDPARQIQVIEAISAQLTSGERAICGVMLESNLVGGTQDHQAQPLVYGRSVTDACLSWDETLPLFDQLAEAVRSRRKVGPESYGLACKT